MAKEWILNMATNRWGLNKKNSVGPVSNWIRECQPKTVMDWENCYYKKLSEFLKSKNIEISPKDYIIHLGQKLYVKITEVIQAEIEQVNENDCVEYIFNLLINRTFDGYQTEIKTIYGQLEQILKTEIKPAPDEWDRLYNVDFYIQVKDKYIGLQIKPISYEQTPQVHNWKAWLSQSHKKFEQKFGGKVFILLSVKKGNQKEIFNKEITTEILSEIRRLKDE